MELLNKRIHKKLGIPAADQLTLKYQGDEIDIKDPNATVGSIMNEENGYHVECEIKVAGFFRKDVTLMNATDKGLQVVASYEVRKFRKERDVR